MPTWTIALVAAAVGTFVGGLAVVVTNGCAAIRVYRRERRIELLNNVLPNLGPASATQWRAGSYHSGFEAKLQELRSLSSVAGRRDERLAAVLHNLWREAIPVNFIPTTGYSDEDPLTQAQSSSIGEANASMARYLEHQLAPKARKFWRSSIHWED